MRSTIDNSRYPLRSILVFGFGMSILLHLGLMWGILRWWQPAAIEEEPIEITIVEPVEIAPVKSTSPTTEIAAKPSDKLPSPVISTPITTAISPAIPKRSSNPKTLKSPPKQIDSKLKSTPNSIGTQSSPQSKSLARANSGKPILTTKTIGRGSPPTKPKAQPSRMLSKALPFPSNLSAAPIEDRISSPPTRSFSLPISPKPKSKAKSNQPTRSARSESAQASESKPVPANPLPSSTPPAAERTIEPIQPTPTTSTPLLLKTPVPIATTPNPLPTRSSPLPRSANNFPQPQDLPRSTKNLPIGSTNDRQVNPNPAGGGVLPKQGGTNSVNSGSLSSSNPGDLAGTKNGLPTGDLAGINGTGSDRGKTGGTSTENGTGTGTSNGNGMGNGSSGLQCIKNCQIAELQDLQDSDGGKDRLRIRVSIDANGIVTAAEIVKSSGNPQIDRTVRSGIEQMQFQPSGKQIKGIIRANIFL